MSKICTGCQRCGNITLCCQLCYLNLCSSGFTFHLLSAETNVGFYPVVAKQVFKWLWEEVCPVNQFRNLRLLCLEEMASVQFSSVQSLSHVQLFATPWITARQAFLFITISWSSLKLTSFESVMPCSHLILCRPLLLLPPIPPSIRVFSSESTLRMRWPKYWNFSFSIIPSKEIPGLISFRMDWLDLLAVQGTLKSLL